MPLLPNAALTALRPITNRIRDLIVRAHRQEVRTQIEDLTARHRKEMETVRGELEGVRGEVDRLTNRAFLLERLLTSNVDMRPPGAAKTVRRQQSPAVAVIIPTHRRSEFVVEAIASVQRQLFQDWELVIVGDGYDQTTEIAVQPFLQDPRIRYVWQERAGAENARNRGLVETSAPLVAYLDDDNLWYPEFLACAVDVFATQPETDLVYGALVTHLHGLDRSCILWRPFDRNKLLQENYIDTNVIVHRRELVEKFGGWTPHTDQFGDWDLALRYTEQKAPVAIAVLAAFYRECDEIRVSRRPGKEDAAKAILARWTVT